jgi:DNA modification methylase
MSGKNWDVWLGDSAELLSKLEPESVDCCITSPPFDGLRARVSTYQSDFDFERCVFRRT